MPDPLLIIPSYIGSPKHGEVLSKCVRSLRETTDAELLIVDDGSPLHQADKDSVYGVIANSITNSNLKIKYSEENQGFSKTVNIGLQRALDEGKDAVLVNSDIEFIEYGWLETMATTEAGIVGALLLYPNYLIQHAGIYFSILTRAFTHRFTGCPPNLPAALVECECQVTAALQYIKHEVLEDVGIYDEKFLLGMEDVDYTIRAIKAGHKSLYNPKVKALHHESLVRKEKSDKIKKWEHESYVHLRKKWHGVDFRDVAPTLMERKYAIS